MTKKEKSIGEALGEIRRIKGLTQNEVASKELTRSSITKIETNKVSPSYDKILIFCKRLGVTLSEVVYYQNDRKVSEQEMLLYEFRNLKVSVYEDPLNSLIEKMDEYLLREHDVMIFELRGVLKGLKVFSETNDVALARKEVDFIWERLEKQDYWFEFDVLLIANIIYVFDLETLIRYAEKVLIEVDKNKYLISYNRLKMVLTINIALLLKTHNRMDLVPQYLNRGREYAYQNGDLVAAHIAEYRFAEYHLYSNDFEKAEALYKKSVRFFKEIGDKALLHDIQTDWKKYRAELKLD